MLSQSQAVSVNVAKNNQSICVNVIKVVMTCKDVSLCDVCIVKNIVKIKTNNTTTTTTITQIKRSILTKDALLISQQTTTTAMYDLILIMVTVVNIRNNKQLAQTVMFSDHNKTFVVLVLVIKPVISNQIQIDIMRKSI